MKQLSTYILEKFKISNTSKRSWEHFPEKRYELAAIIRERCKECQKNNSRVLDLTDVKIHENIWDFRFLFGPSCKQAKIKEINVAGWDVTHVTDMEGCFYDCTYLQRIIGINNWDMKNVKNISSMFGACSYLKELSVPNWDIRSVNNASFVFLNCKRLKSVDISGWVFDNVDESLNLDGMFGSCSKLTELQLFKLNKRVENADKFGMFSKVPSQSIPDWYLK